MEFFNSLFYFIVVIGILVFIHEFGHFIAARISGMRVDIFSFGMGYRILGYNKRTGFSFGNLPKEWESDGFCDYRISLFPIGGYVKVAGMIDESMDTKQMASEPQPWEFRSKNVFLKVFVLSAGVIMNALLTIFIFAGIGLINGNDIWLTTRIGYVDKNSLADRIGLKSGDKILEINNKKVEHWKDIVDGLTLKEFGKSRTVKVKRDTLILNLKAEGKSIVKTVTGGQTALGLNPVNLFISIIETVPGSPAEKTGLKPFDTLISINNNKINAFSELQKILGENKNKPIMLKWKRVSEILKDTITPDSKGLLGFRPNIGYSGKTEHYSYSVLEAVEYGFKETYRFAELFIRSIEQIFRGNISAKESLGGPIMIAKSASASASMGWESFFSFMALLSITLAIINIVPFPALDGGHIVFVTIEAIIRRELPLKFKIVVQNIGMILLLGLMAFAFYNDIMRLFGK